VHYLANGHKGFEKERLEVFAGGRVLQLENFLTLRGWGWPGFKTHRLWRQDKGVMQCVKAFVDAMSGKAPQPIPLEEIFEVSRTSIEIAESLQ
jgi:hypothetical protein